jgi:hypothetical protein
VAVRATELWRVLVGHDDEQVGTLSGSHAAHCRCNLSEPQSTGSVRTCLDQMSCYW